MLTSRIVTALIVAPVFVVAALWAPGWFFAVLLGLIGVLAVLEWSRLTGANGLAVILLGAALVIASLWWPAISRVVIWLGVLWWLYVTYNLLVRYDRLAPNTLLAGVAGGLALFVPPVCGLLLLHAESTPGRYLVLYVLLLIWCADSAAYFTGRRFGRHRLAPAISPGKTVEGMVGGLAAVAILAFGVGRFAEHVRDSMLVLWVALSVLVALVSVIGDLYESRAKRIAGVKDSGSLLPGHGGVLDRIDSALAAVPVFVVGVWLLRVI